MESLIALGPLGLLLAVVVSVVGGVAAYLAWGRALQEPAQHPLLAELGLTRTPTQGWRGRVGDAEISYRASTPHRAGGFGVEAPLGSLSLCPRAWHRYLPVEAEVRLGDAPFDERFQLRGDPADLARLTAEVRAALRAVPRECEVWLADGRVWVDSGQPQRGDLELALKLVALLARAPAAPEERMTAWARSDPLPEVRERALASLAAHHPELAQRLASRARLDRSPQVRAQAALLLRDVGLLFEVATDPALSLEQRTAAVNRLGACGGDTDRLRLGEHLARHPTLGLLHHAVALLRAVGSDGEAGLLELLSLDEAELTREVLSALADVGTIRAIPVLREHQARLGLMQSRRHEAIERTIASIQANTGGERGGLAIAPVQGALALSAPQGAVAVALRASREGG